MHAFSGMWLGSKAYKDRTSQRHMPLLSRILTVLENNTKFKNVLRKNEQLLQPHAESIPHELA